MKTGMIVYCRQCHREGEADTIRDRHTGFRPVNRCDFCNSINVKVIGFEAPDGIKFGRLKVERSRLLPDREGRA